MNASREMPRYVSHKTVWALEIGDAYPVAPNGDGSVQLPIKDDGFADVTVPRVVVERYFPSAGDFLVQYADGYQSISPRKAFVEGYKAENPNTSKYASIARICHEVNRAYCASIGDDSQPGWADAPAWQRESATNGVKFAIDNPDAEPSASHESWSAEKTAAGWVFGPVKDPEAKQHPCLVPYGDLPVEQRTKDYLFLAVVRALA